MVVLICFLITIPFALAAVLYCKNEKTHENRSKIFDAIYAYRCACIHENPWHPGYEVDYEDAEPYNKTLMRLWDWGYTRILPVKKFNLIKPYIED